MTLVVNTHRSKVCGYFKDDVNALARAIEYLTRRHK